MAMVVEDKDKDKKEVLTGATEADIELSLSSLLRTSADYKAILRTLLVSNVPHSILDSGGAYGYHHIRNKFVNFDEQPKTDMKVFMWGDNEVELELTHSIYHWLLEKTHYAPIETQMFYTWLDYIWDKGKGKYGMSDEEGHKLSWFENTTDSALAFFTYVYIPMREFFVDPKTGDFVWPGYDTAIKLMPEDFDVTVQERINQGSNLAVEHQTINTYNGADLLSQVMQYVVVELDDEEFVAISIHGGADVRGGYHAVFMCKQSSEWSLYTNADAVLACDNSECDGCWYTTNAGYNFYGSSSLLADLDRETLTKCFVLDEGEEEGEEVFSRRSGTLRCPECGKGTLKAYFD